MNQNLYYSLRILPKEDVRFVSRILHGCDKEE